MDKIQAGKRNNKTAYNAGDYGGCLPIYTYMTEGKRVDVKHAQYMQMPKNSVIVSDRGYQDFKMMYEWKKDDIIFVMMLKKTIKYEQVKELSLKEEKEGYILKDEVISLAKEETKQLYPENLRRVAIYDE